MDDIGLDLSRRKFVAGAAAGVACCAAPAARAQPQRPANPAIDIHHHFLPPAYKAAAGENLRSFATGAADVLAWTPERSLAAMDAANVDCAVLSISAPGVSFGDRAAARALAAECNDYAAGLAIAHPGRFRFFVTLPMPDVEGSIAELDRVYRIHRPEGAGLLSNYDGRYLGDPAFAPLFAALDPRGALIYVHPTNAACCLALTPGIPAPLIEFPVDTARAMSSLLWSGTLSRYTRARFVFSHGGGVMPMVIERVSAVGLINPDRAALVPEGPRAALARAYVDTASVTYPAAMAALGAWLPPSQILFGTDYPWGQPARARAALAGLGMGAATLAAIERGNARALLSS